MFWWIIQSFDYVVAGYIELSFLEPVLCLKTQCVKSCFELYFHFLIRFRNAICKQPKFCPVGQLKDCSLETFSV